MNIKFKSIIFGFILIFIISISVFFHYQNKGYCFKTGEYFDEKFTINRVVYKMVNPNDKQEYFFYLHRHIYETMFNREINDKANISDIPRLENKVIDDFIQKNPDCCKLYTKDELKKLYTEAPEPHLFDKIKGVEYALFSINFKKTVYYLEDKKNIREFVGENFSIDSCGEIGVRKNYIEY